MHAMCACCWESGGRFWAGCSTCGTRVDVRTTFVAGGEGADVQHSEAMAARLSAPKVKSEYAAAHRARLKHWQYHQRYIA